MSELRITPVQVPVSQAKGVDQAFLAAAQQGSVQRGLPQPAVAYSAPATGGALVTAYLIDLACLVAITALSWWFYPSIAIAVIVALETWIVGTLIRAHSGRPPGAFAMQVAAISMAPVATDAGPEAGHAPGLARQSAHSLIMLLLHLSVIGPAVTWVIARDGQTWVDRVCGMGNLDVRAGRTDAGAPAYSQQLSPSFAEASAGVGAAPAQLQGMDPAALAPAHQWAGPRVASPEVPASEPALLSVPPAGVPAADLPAPSPMPEAPSQVLSEMPAPVPTQQAQPRQCHEFRRCQCPRLAHLGRPAARRTLVSRLIHSQWPLRPLPQRAHRPLSPHSRRRHLWQSLLTMGSESRSMLLSCCDVLPSRRLLMRGQWQLRIRRVLCRVHTCVSHRLMAMRCGSRTPSQRMARGCRHPMAPRSHSLAANASRYRWVRCFCWVSGSCRLVGKSTSLGYRYQRAQE